MPEDRRDYERRSFLKLSVLLAGLAGCGSQPRSGTDTERGTTATEQRRSPTQTPEPESTATATDTPVDDAGEYPGYENLPNPLDVDSSNPFVQLNDQSTDNYMGELALAMADSDTVDLRGFLLGYPREVWKNETKYERHREEYVTNHEKTYRMAVESGMENLPSPEFGVFDHHEKPSSGRVEDTDAIGSAGTDLIVEEARNASPENPLVVAVGGDVCTVADAYLTDPSIADSLVVYWHEQVADINEQSGYNVQNSGWSAYVALTRLATVLDHSRGGYTITEEEVENRVPSPLDEYMMSKEHWKWGNPLQSTDWSDEGEFGAGDEKALLLAAYPFTREGSEPMSVSGLQRAEWDYEPKNVLPTLSSGDSDSRLVEIPNTERLKSVFWQSWES
mgnify:CR=1 FL=1